MKLRHLFPLLLVLTQIAHAEIVAADRVIAVVNNEAVTEYDLKQRMAIAL